MSRTPVNRIAIAAVGTALVLVAYYALDRSRAAIMSPSIDPSLVIAGERIEYFWRVTICAYASPLVFAALFVASRGREEAAWRWIHRAVAPVSLIAAALAAIFP